MNLPQRFLDNLSSVIGEDHIQRFLEGLESDREPSIRFNPFKLAQKPQGRNAPWSRYGYYLDSRPVFTLDPLFHAGVYYVQDASSMFLEQVFEQDPTIRNAKGLRVLDLCAAPGGKSTHISNLIGADSLLVANEVIRSRANILRENVIKWGIGNIVVTNNDPKHFSSLKSFFDVVLVDAPCSGEGMFRKSKTAIEEWSVENVSLCSARQQRILADVWDSLKEGGVVIYSTCTFNRSENEGNIEWMAENFDIEPIDIECDSSWGVVETTTSGIKGFRFYPCNLSGEGLFMSAFRKVGGGAKRRQVGRRNVLVPLSKKDHPLVTKWINEPYNNSFFVDKEGVINFVYNEFVDDINELTFFLNVIYYGVEMGQIFKSELKPSHPLALFHDINRDAVPFINVDIETARNYLRKADIDPTLFHESINLIGHNSIPIGFVKRIGRRCNNLYPKEFRIIHL